MKKNINGRFAVVLVDAYCRGPNNLEDNCEIHVLTHLCEEMANHRFSFHFFIRKCPSFY